MRRTPAFFAGEEEAHLKKMLDADVIQPSISEWASAPVLIRKKDGQIQWCLDYRHLNNVIRKDVFPLPLIDECLGTLSGNVCFSKLDANFAFHQPSSPGTACTNLLKWGSNCAMPQPLFPRAMNLMLRGLTWNIVLAFLDDALVLGKELEDHLANLRSVLPASRNSI